MQSLLILILLLLYNECHAQNSKFCPSADWIFCAIENDNCQIDPRVKSFTMSMGGQYNNAGTWLFWHFTNANSKDYSIWCSWANLGDPMKGSSESAKGCCYNPSNATTNESDWHLVATEGETFKTSGIQYVRFGDAGQYVHRYLEGEFICESYYHYNSSNMGQWDGYFPDPQNNHHGSGRSCYFYKPLNQTAYSSSTFAPCGNTNTGTCNTNVAGNGDSMALIQYGNGPNTANQWLYLYAYQTKNEVPCSWYMFNPAREHGGNQWYGNYCGMYKGGVFGSNPVVGSWIQVGSCLGCPYLTESITEGTTSSSKEATTTSWTMSLSDKVSEGIIFEKEELTYEVSSTVSNEVESSYSYTETHTCSAKCGNGTEAYWFMYQWQMNADEYQGVDTSTFKIEACNWVCNNQNEKPKCPPGYCKDFACQTCIDY
eukprot:242247_1